MVGRTLAQYRVEERLGKGGMGTVYRAFDTRLKRNVAIKILSRSEESENELARLLGEARAAAPLNHPAIATIGQPERALEQLRLAAKTGLPNYPLFLGDRHFDSLRARPDFREFGSGGSQGDVF